MAHVRGRVGDRPLFIVGYSNGGALAVHYALEALEDAQLPQPDRLVLLSPEIGITKLAALAVWQDRLGRLLGLQKLAWNSILPEYDSYKYGSFALNAGEQAYLITREIQSRMAKLGPTGELKRFPPTLAFQSVVDATVSAPVLVTGLFDRLPRGGHELVLFDVNRFTDIEPILKQDPGAWLHDMLRDADSSFKVSVLTNESAEKRAVVLRQRQPGKTEVTTADLGLRWPRDVYSLAHVALPFPPDDPLYGGRDAGESPGLQLGKLALRGERGVLVIGASDMLRLRWNPFHTYVRERVVQILHDLEGKALNGVPTEQASK
jgi:alpha-beta hydrolase superfamily lysophospholipase